MKNIPFFTTESGGASLTLEQIPFNRTAYIRIQSSCEPGRLLKECRDFCRAVGAKTVYATGIEEPDNSISVASVIRMTRDRAGLPGTDLTAVSVDETNGEPFRDIYNKKMHKIPFASAIRMDDLNAIIERKNGYYLYRCQELVGIGVADGAWIRAVVSLKRGAGKEIMLALNQVLEGDAVTVELVDINKRAKDLYESLGFCFSETVSTWYKIL